MKSEFERNHQKDQPETVNRIEAKITADSCPKYTKEERKKCRCTKMNANHQTKMEESVIANIVIEEDIRSILGDCIWNIPVAADEIRLESAKASVIRKAMYYAQKKWPAPPIQG